MLETQIIQGEIFHIIRPFSGVENTFYIVKFIRIIALSEFVLDYVDILKPRPPNLRVYFVQCFLQNRWRKIFHVRFVPFVCSHYINWKFTIFFNLKLFAFFWSLKKKILLLHLVFTSHLSWFFNKPKCQINKKELKMFKVRYPWNNGNKGFYDF